MPGQIPANGFVTRAGRFATRPGEGDLLSTALRQIVISPR